MQSTIVRITTLRSRTCPVPILTSTQDTRIHLMNNMVMNNVILRTPNYHPCPPPHPVAHQFKQAGQQAHSRIPHQNQAQIHQSNIDPILIGKKDLSTLTIIQPIKRNFGALSPTTNQLTNHLSLYLRSTSGKMFEISAYSTTWGVA